MNRMYEIKKHIITTFGSVAKVAQICGVTPGAVSQWSVIPARHQVALLNFAQERNLDLTSEDFFSPRSEVESGH